MILRVDAQSPVPPYEQIRAQVSTMVQTGVLADGVRLPSIRQLAKDLGLASGTVARAYRELETDGIVVTRGRHGTVVTANSRTSPIGERRRQVEQAATASRWKRPTRASTSIRQWMPSAVRSVGSSSKGDRHDHHRRAIGRRERGRVGRRHDRAPVRPSDPELRSDADGLGARGRGVLVVRPRRPRLETTLGPVGGGTDSVIVTVKISNPTPLSVRLLGVDLRARGLRIDRVVDGAEGSTRAFRPIRLASSEQRAVTLIGHGTRCGQDVSFSDGDLVVRARTALGIRRSLQPSIGVYNLGSPLAPCSDS